MLKLFRHNLIVYSSFLVGYVLLLRLAPFVIPVPIEPEHEAFLSKVLYEVGRDTWWLKLLAIILVILQGIQINRLVNLNRLHPSNTMFAGIMYILLISLGNKMQFLYPQLFANTFLIAAIQSVFSAGRDKSVAPLFNGGFWIGVASLFYFPYFLFLIPLICGHLFLRSLHSYDIIRSLSGLLVPFFLAFTFLYITGQLPMFSLTFIYAFSLFHFQLGPGWQSYLILGIFIIFFLMSIVVHERLTTGVALIIKKKINILLWILFTGIFIFLIAPVVYLHALIVIAMPLSIFVGAQFLNIDNESTAEGLHMILLVLALLLQYVL